MPTTLLEATSKMTLSEDQSLAALKAQLELTEGIIARLEKKGKFTDRHFMRYMQERLVELQGMIEKAAA